MLIVTAESDSTSSPKDLQGIEDGGPAMPIAVHFIAKVAQRLDHVADVLA